MSTIEEIFQQIEALSFSDKILVLSDLAKKIQKGANKNVKLSKEEKEAKPKRVMPPNPWNAFIAHKLAESPEMFEGVVKRSGQIKILSAYRKENENEYKEFVENFNNENPKPAKDSSDVESSSQKPKKVVKEEKTSTKAAPVSVVDKAAEIKKKLAEKNASKDAPKVTKVSPKPVEKDFEFDPFASIPTNNGASSSSNINPFEEEKSDLVNKTIKGKKYKFDPISREIYSEDCSTLIGLWNPKTSKIEEIEA
jgi:hypothetical protein